MVVDRRHTSDPRPTRPAPARAEGAWRARRSNPRHAARSTQHAARSTLGWAPFVTPLF